MKGGAREGAGHNKGTDNGTEKSGTSSNVKKLPQVKAKQPVDGTDNDKIPIPPKLVKIEDSEGFNLKITVHQGQNEFGSNDDDFVEGILMQTIMASTFGSQDKQLKGNAALAAFSGLQPKDPAEAMLISQMVAVHNMAMEMARRVTNTDITVELITMYVNFVTKLMRTSTAQIEALNKYRTKGQQKITVQHVNVNDGGQAVIGDVKQGGG